MKRYLPTILLVCRIIIGVTFIFSGFVKAVDPLGSTYKFIDYFNAFGMGWANGLAFGLAVLQNVVEFSLGVMVLFNLRLRLSSALVLAFMVFYTPLTLYIAIANPVHDCGCFGDALVITNWQTFFKNVVLLAATILVFAWRDKQPNRLTIKEQWALSGVTVVAIVVFCGYSHRHTQVLDFRPYSVGTSIPEKMERPAGAPADVWESTFVYEKDGKQETFQISNLPDSTWTFVDARHTLVKKGYEPPIHDFSIVNPDGEDLTVDVLASDNYNFLLIAYNLDKSDLSRNDSINRLADFCLAQGYTFRMLTASTDEAIESFREVAEPPYEICICDETTLKTIVRSNPGLMVVKDGVIIGKWNLKDIPPLQFFEGNLLAKCIDYQIEKQRTFYTWLLILSLAFIASIYLLARKRFGNENKHN